MVVQVGDVINPGRVAEKTLARRAVLKASIGVELSERLFHVLARITLGTPTFRRVAAHGLTCIMGLGIIQVPSVITYEEFVKDSPPYWTRHVRQAVLRWPRWYIQYDPFYL